MLDVGFHNIPQYEYHALDLVSNSQLGILAKSPAHLKHYRENKADKYTDALRFGSAVHAAILEPSYFERYYRVKPKFDRRYKEQKAASELWDLENAGKIAIAADEHEHCLSIADAVREHEKAGPLVEASEANEQTAIWKHERTGLMCKSRIDAICPQLKTIFDIKTTRCADRHQFEKSIFDFGYYRQGAFYIDACRALGIDIEHYAIIAIEKEPPFGLMVYRLTNPVIDLGRRENESLLTLWRDCAEADIWPSYPAQIQDIGLPAWAEKRIEEDLRR